MPQSSPPSGATPEITTSPTTHDHHHRPMRGLYGLVAGLSMSVGRTGIATTVADLARVAPGDRVLDVGCGPGAAVREAARRGAVVTGVDPAPIMLQLARRATRHIAGVTLLEGAAEALPLPDGSVDVAWSIATAHHWDDSERALAELHRVLVPGGRLVIAERLVREGARGHAAHGATPATGAEVVEQATAARFVDASFTTHGQGRHTQAVVTATKPA